MAKYITMTASIFSTNIRSYVMRGSCHFEIGVEYWNIFVGVFCEIYFGATKKKGSIRKTIQLIARCN